MSGYRVESTPDADEHARAIDAWWREQRPASPDLFLDELTRTLALLATLPMLGVPYERASTTAGMRRLAMRRTKCHLYYTVDTGQRELLVQAIWHASRGHGPF